MPASKKNRSSGLQNKKRNRATKTQEAIQKTLIKSRKLAPREVPAFDMQAAMAEDIAELNENQPQNPTPPAAHVINSPTPAELRQKWDEKVWGNTSSVDRQLALTLRQEADYAKAEHYYLLVKRSWLRLEVLRLKAIFEVAEGPQIEPAWLELKIQDDACRSLESWISQRRRELDGDKWLKCLCDDRENAILQLRYLDIHSGLVQINFSAATKSNQSTNAPNSEAGPSPWGSLLDLYRPEFKRRTVVIPEWVHFVIRKRMRELHKTQQAYKGIGNLYVVMAQLLYWAEPRKDGTPRAAGKHRILDPENRWLISRNVFRLAKQTGLSRSAVDSATRRLDKLGFIAIRVKKDDKSKWYRISFEKFKPEVDAWMAEAEQRRPMKSKFKTTPKSEHGK